MSRGRSRRHPAAATSLQRGDSSRRGRARPRVVSLVDVLSLHGGAERIALAIATHLDQERFESIMCVSRWPPSEAWAAIDPTGPQALAELEHSGVRFLPLERRHKVDPPAWGRLARFLREERVEVLHAHKFGSNVWGTLVGRTARVPVLIAHEHSWSYEGQVSRRLIDRHLIARGADRVVAVSREDQRRMVEVEHIDPGKIELVPTAVLSDPPKGGHDVRVELGIDPDTPVVGIVGLLRPEKAQHVLVRASASLIERVPTARVLVVGDGPERRRLEDLATELGVQDHVSFLGLRTDVPDVLRALDVAVLCSRREGTPLSVLEYMEAGLPVVATAVGGVPDLIENGLSGLLVPSEDPQALADALVTLLGEPARARAMGERGRERHQADFDIAVMVRRIEGLYDELLLARGLPTSTRVAVRS